MHRRKPRGWSCHSDNVRLRSQSSCLLVVALNQQFLHKMSLMRGWVIERTKFLITQLFVERTRLKAERIKPGCVAAAFNRTRFGIGHQLTSDTAAAEQPSAIGFSRQAGDDGFRVSNENAERAPRSMAGPLAFVKILQRL